VPESHAPGLTFEELAARAGAPPATIERELLAFVMRDELRRGHVDLDPASGRYTLNGGLDPETRQAFRDLRV
jgi:DNA-binding IclR family transcriptional regulator